MYKRICSAILIMPYLMILAGLLQSPSQAFASTPELLAGSPKLIILNVEYVVDTINPSRVMEIKIELESTRALTSQIRLHLFTSIESIYDCDLDGEIYSCDLSNMPLVRAITDLDVST